MNKVLYSAAVSLALITNISNGAWVERFRDDFTSATQWDATKWDVKSEWERGGTYNSHLRNSIYLQRCVKPASGYIRITSNSDDYTFNNWTYKSQCAWMESYTAWSTAPWGVYNTGYSIRGRVKVINFVQGTNFAFWMRAADGTWPPEIDIFEMPPSYDDTRSPTQYYTSNLHWGSSTDKKSNMKQVLTATTSYHVYRVDNRETHIEYYLDDVLKHRVNQGTYNGHPVVPTKGMTIILSSTVSHDDWDNSWAGTPPNGVWSAEMQVDWVAAYRPDGT